MSEVRHYDVSNEDPDPRGWTVESRDGTRIGEVTDLIVDPGAMKVRYFEVDTGDSARGADSRALVDAYSADIHDHDRRVVIDGGIASLQSARGVLGAPQAAVAHDRGHLSGNETEAARLTRAEEELRIGKREVETGEVVAHKTVDTEHVREPIERRVEHVRVERRPVSARSTADADINADEIRVPIREEEVVVEKRPVVKEEIVLTRDVDTESEVVETDVRKERVDVREEGTKGKGGRHGRH